VAEDEPTSGTAEQRDGPQRASLRFREPELRNDRREHEGEEHHVERVERPAQ
jgi:hypothetical protein